VVEQASIEFHQPISFKAETRQLLDILIHSLYTEREIFLRELISNAADALTRMDFELLTNREVVDPQAELAIRLIPDKDHKTLTVRDTGIGMTAAELVENLGTIAHSGARAFLEAAKEKGQKLGDVIGQFGVGFYSAFMVAESIQVVSRSYQPEAQAVSWQSSGADTYSLEPAEKEARGTDVIVRLKDDALEFLEAHRLREIIRKHSDFIPFPIYIGDETEQANRQTALWRQNPRQVDEKEYEEFYRQLTLDVEKPLAKIHMVVDAPAQMYALLYIPASPERGLFSLRKDDGLKLYSRKVLIQEYCKDLLPDYLRFIQGVVDSEDLPLNVSRETVQSSRVMGQLKKMITSKVIDTLKHQKPEDYHKFWEAYGRAIKQGVAIEQTEPESLYPLLRFHTNLRPAEWTSLDEYVQRTPVTQKEIYYIMGDDERSLVHSPHLDIVRKLGYEVLLMADPLDAFVTVRLREYQGHPLKNVATAQLEAPKEEPKPEAEAQPTLAEAAATELVQRFKSQLGERVADVRMTDRLVDSPARLVDPEGALDQEMQRVYKLLERDFEAPKKVLELNPRHPILARLGNLPAEAPLGALVIEQIYEDALLIEGLHPDPASMIGRLQKIIEAALE
jgi:molecular chaperone HtpG